MKTKPRIELVNGEQRLLIRENQQHVKNQFEIFRGHVQEINGIIALYNSAPALTPLKSEKEVTDLLNNPRGFMTNVIRKECKIITTNKKVEPSIDFLAGIYEIPVSEIMRRAAGAQKYILKDCSFDPKTMSYSLNDSAITHLESEWKQYLSADHTLVYNEMQFFAKELKKWLYVCGIKNFGTVGHFFKMKVDIEEDGTPGLTPDVDFLIRSAKQDPSFFERWEEMFLKEREKHEPETVEENE